MARAGLKTVFQENAVCPYFHDGRVSTVEYLVPVPHDIRRFHRFLAAGYRRIGRVFYRNICEGCSDCIPLRIETGRFLPGKSQRRTLRRNRDIVVQVRRGAPVTADHVLLYDSYMKSKHHEGRDETPDNALKVLFAIHTGYPCTIEMDYYLDGKLIGVGIVDEGRDALSSNYFYYDTAFLDRRPGIFSILQEIELARSLGKKYHYLGFSIEHNPKMAYKIQFRPNQFFRNGHWREFTTDKPLRE
ncbi:MAG: arginyltransferase [Nitrospiraceae bacterium]|nr:MAG: arginyltransferase [Nitrospiraceae bacterium]